MIRFWDSTIRIWDGMIRTWDSKTGEPLVSSAEDLRGSVSSIMIVRSSDGSKLYSSHNFARVFDSVSGTQVHCVEHDKPLHCVALSSKYNDLACVGWHGTAQLWDTEFFDDLASRS